MSDAMMAGLFALAGVLLGGLISYKTALIGDRREKAQKKILQLCDQVSAFYQLEQLYKDELARLDPSGRSGKATMEHMRSRVEELGEYKRPTMTTGEVNKIRSEWS